MAEKWKRIETLSQPAEPTQKVDDRRYRYIVFHPYMRPIEENRYRDCQSIGCGKSFKFMHEDDWTCPDCRKQRAEVERRQRAEGSLLGANSRVKL